MQDVHPPFVKGGAGGRYAPPLLSKGVQAKPRFLPFLLSKKKQPLRLLSHDADIFLFMCISVCVCTYVYRLCASSAKNTNLEINMEINIFFK